MLQHLLLTASALAQQLQLAQLQQQPAQPASSCSPGHTVGPAAEPHHVHPAFALVRLDVAGNAVKTNEDGIEGLGLFPTPCIAGTVGIFKHGALKQKHHLEPEHLDLCQQWLVG